MDTSRIVSLFLNTSHTTKRQLREVKVYPVARLLRGRRGRGLGAGAALDCERPPRLLEGLDVAALARALAHERDFQGALLAGREPRLGVLHVHRVAHGEVRRDAVAHEPARDGALQAVVDLEHALQRAPRVEERAHDRPDRGARVLGLHRDAVEVLPRDHVPELILAEVQAVVRAALAGGVRGAEDQHMPGRRGAIYAQTTSKAQTTSNPVLLRFTGSAS